MNETRGNTLATMAAIDFILLLVVSFILRLVYSDERFYSAVVMFGLGLLIALVGTDLIALNQDTRKWLWNGLVWFWTDNTPWRVRWARHS